MSGNFTLFKSDPSGATSGSNFEKDVFIDVSLAATSNSGLTDSASTNPLGVYVGNDDTPRYSAKTLWIKDMVLLPEYKWVSNKPTYQCIFDESFYGGIAYFFGDIDTTTNVVKGIGDGFGVTGVYRRVQFIVEPSTSATATAQVVVDGSNGSTIDFSGSIAAAGMSSYVHAASNVTKDLHDFRLTAIQASTLKVLGVVVYSENSGLNLDFFPGTTYVNKTQAVTTVGGTMALPSFGSSMGGKSLLYKTSSGAYSASSLSATTIASIAQGSSGTNLMTVTTGQGASFSAGYGVVVAQGTSMYVGSVTSVSTDTLTVSPTLGFGITNAIYTSWKSGSTLSINASLMTLAYSIDMTQQSVFGMSAPILDPQGHYAAYGSNVGITFAAGASYRTMSFLSGSGFFQVDGYYSAAEVEFVGYGILHATFSVNGTPGFGINAGQTGPLRKTVFTDAGPGWNSFVMSPGTSMGALGISKVNLYQRNRDISVTYGMLAAFDTLQTYTERASVNATLMALGTYRRVYSDQMYLKGSWVRGQSTSFCAGVGHYGSSTNSAIRLEYYGKNFAMVGTGQSGNLTIDGASTSNAWGVMKSVATEGFHTITWTLLGGTSIIEAIDYSRPTSSLLNLQKAPGDVNG